jgi:hypothetical protein
MSARVFISPTFQAIASHQITTENASGRSSHASSSAIITSTAAWVTHPSASAVGAMP